jgi:hypothetical protein
MIQANSAPHQETLDAPKVVSEAVAEDSHRVALLQVNGNGLEAVGSYSEVKSRGDEDTPVETNVGGHQWKTNFAIGHEAMMQNRRGLELTAVGYRAHPNNKTGNANTALGASALFKNIDGSRNTAVGNSALFGNSGEDNTAVGTWALAANTTGTRNTAVRSHALGGRLVQGGGWSSPSGTFQKGNENTAAGHAAL